MLVFSSILPSGAFTSIILSLTVLLPLSVLKPANPLKSSGSVIFSGIPVSIYSAVSFTGNSGSWLISCTVLRFLPNFLFNSSRNTGIFSIFLFRLSSSVSCFWTILFSLLTGIFSSTILVLPASFTTSSGLFIDGLSMPAKGITASSGFFIAGFSFLPGFLLPATISSIVFLPSACLRLFSSISLSVIFISIRFTDCMAGLLSLACGLLMDGCGTTLYEGAW